MSDDQGAGTPPTYEEMLKAATERVVFSDACFICDLPLTEEIGAVELVYDDGETEWVCFPCAANLPRQPLEHPDYDAERIEARDFQMLPMADRGRPIEDVPPNERL